MIGEVPKLNNEINLRKAFFQLVTTCPGWGYQLPFYFSSLLSLPLRWMVRVSKAKKVFIYQFSIVQLSCDHFTWYFSSILSSLLFIQPFSWIALEGKIWENIIFWERWGKTFLWEGKYTNVFPHIFTLKSFFFEDIFFFIYPAYILHHEIEETWEVLLR